MEKSVVGNTAKTAPSSGRIAIHIVISGAFWIEFGHNRTTFAVFCIDEGIERLNYIIRITIGKSKNKTVDSLALSEEEINQ